MNTDLTDFHNRSIHQATEHERREKEKAQQHAGRISNLLIKIARIVAAKEIEEAKRLDPIAPDSWGPAQWEEFFSTNNIESRIQTAVRTQLAPRAPEPAPAAYIQSAPPPQTRMPAEPPPPPPLPEVHRLPGEIETPAPPEQEADPPFSDLFSGVPEKTTKLKSVPPEHENTGLRDALLAYRGIKTPNPPLRMSRFVSTDATRWQRQAAILYFISYWGINAKPELDLLFAHAIGVKPRSSSIHRAFESLVESGLISKEELTITKPKKTSLIVYRLEDEGREFCSLLNWGPVESDWERLVRLHQGEELREHTAAVLIFTMHVRLRGWKTQILPFTEDDSEPDVLIIKDKERHYVEVERGKKEMGHKWNGMKKLQGYVALCAGGESNRIRIEKDLKLKGIPFYATDMPTLIANKILEVDRNTPLWSSEWGNPKRKLNNDHG